MRIRHKAYAYPELCASELFVRLPIELRGAWKDAFADPTLPFHLELGCGKGGFCAEYAFSHKDVNILAVDIKSEVLVLAKRKLEKRFADAGESCENALITSHDIERIFLILAPEDRVERIFINFCNPWPKLRHQKKRLTHTRQLMKYREFLVDGGEIEFKTDDAELFEDSLGYFEQSGFEVVELSRDIYADGIHKKSIPTEHETMFAQMGIQIKYARAIKKEIR